MVGKTNKIIIAVVLVAVVAVAVVAGVYYCSPAKSDTPKAQAVTNFSDGAWANYTAQYYAGGNVVAEGSFMVYTVVGTYNGADCWTYVENQTYKAENSTVISEVVTYTLDKTTYSNLHQTNQIYQNGVVTYTKDIAPNDVGFANDLTGFQSMTVAASDESVTVPAGTYNTTRLDGGSMQYYVTGDTYTYSAWTNPNVPCWGIVKYQFYNSNNELDTCYLLQSCGS